MFSIDSSENSSVTNGAENSNNNNLRALPPSLYSANTTMLSFNNVEQSYTRVVGQVYSRETVTTIYGDPPTAFWNRYYCYICRSAINPRDLISCASTTCDIFAHTACLINIGIHEKNGIWHCQKCIPTTRHEIYLPSSNNNVERNVPQSTENNSDVTAQQYDNNNPDLSHENLSNLNPPSLSFNFNFNSFNNNDTQQESAVKKFETQYASFDEERSNLIRNLERTRTRQNQVTEALKESITRLTREHTKNLEKRDNLRKENHKLNNALHKLKLALIPLAQEKPVLQILQKVSQNEELQEQDINLNNVLSLFMGLLPKSTHSALSGLVGNDTFASSSSSVQNASSNFLFPEICQKCLEKGGNLVFCFHCQRAQHVDCCVKEEKPFYGKWMCDECKNNLTTKRKHCDDKNSKFPTLTLIGNYKRIKINEKDDAAKENTPVYNNNMCNLDDRGDRDGRDDAQNDDSERYASNNTQPEDNENNENSYDGRSESEIEMKNSNDLTYEKYDRTPPPDNGPEASRQPARFDGDMYTPRWVRGVGKSKEGLCPHCEPPRWLKTKISAYWYHLNYQHGISSITGRPFTQPTSERINKKTGMKEAMCHKCNKWVLNQSPRDKEVLVPEIYW
ncbi:6396_t:CDS:2 [Diversispora eburnea]|uniref:6396_t:CDS:1 n=1 Tax=Diversispora eburnea TaxID=1213867 RepID=A0A9N9AJM2_9GLOM|nr:6396_t:CDS:2 [Diversispora eburnea]